MSYIVSRYASILICATTAAIVAVSLALSAASAAYVTVYGGPAYNAVTQTGYQSPLSMQFPSVWTAGNGVAVGGAQRYIGGANIGQRAVRWDASGVAATE